MYTAIVDTVALPKFATAIQTLAFLFLIYDAMLWGYFV